MKTKERKDIPEKYKWDLEAMYPDESKWQEDVDTALKLSEDFAKFKGRVADDGKSLFDALQTKDDIWLTLERAFVYAHMRKDEDNRNDKYVEMLGNINTIASKASTNMSFFLPELIERGEDYILSLFDQCKDLELYRFYIENILRKQKHVLSSEEENLLSQFSEVCDAPDEIFTILNDADMKFGTIKDENGNEQTLTHGNYVKFLKSKDRRVRKDAFEGMYNAFKNLANTITTTYNYNVKTSVMLSKIRKYGSARQAALSGGNIPETVYDNLIKIVGDYLPVLHKYIELRKKILGVDKLYMYDVYVPLFSEPNTEIPFEKGIEMAKEGLAPMGEEYIERLSKGIEDRWIDVYETEGKTSGAYSFGSYDSMPYVLMNYTGLLNDVFTIVHELGHSMHSSYTRETQPFIYGDHSIFTAEVASTVNESLLMKNLISKEKDAEALKYLINHYLEEFRTTLFRQTMFAEFEKITHDQVENGNTLTCKWLCDQYKGLNEKYFGKTVEDDEFIQYEWARIPHFYRDFYVYQYATGFSAATAISKKIIEEGQAARDAYKEFLKTGSSNYPVELLKIAGVDMSSPEPIRLAMETFKSLVEQLEELVD